MKKSGIMVLALLLAACGGQKSSDQAGTESVKGNVHEVQTSVYNARMEDGNVVKDGKPDMYREVDFFLPEDVRVYNRDGQLDSVKSVVDGIEILTVYAYKDGQRSGEKVFQNGELFTDRQFVYKNGNLVNTLEDMYIGGQKTSNEYPVDLSKVKEENGNRVEYGETERDYVIKDAQGRVLKESSYSEMDDYLTVKEYTYNAQGWLETVILGDEYRAMYEYSDLDQYGNWTRLVISLNGKPYGIVERTITYYE